MLGANGHQIHSLRSIKLQVTFEGAVAPNLRPGQDLWCICVLISRLGLLLLLSVITKVIRIIYFEVRVYSTRSIKGVDVGSKVQGFRVKGSGLNGVGFDKQGLGFRV